jgi:hypothetical protein
MSLTRFGAPRRQGWRVRFAGLDSGRYEITIRRIGYALFRDTIGLTSATKIDRDFPLPAQAVQLDSVRIAAARGS